MGTMNFLLTGSASTEAAREMARGYVVGAPDYMPWPTEIQVANGQVVVRRPVDDSGCICLPWRVPSHGLLLLSTATLIERPDPYLMGVELARGRVNILRNQAADWQMGGLSLGPELTNRIQESSIAFAHAVCRQDAATEAGELADTAIQQAIDAGQALVQTYVDQVFETRQQRQGRLATAWTVGLNGPVPNAEQTALIKKTFNCVRIPFPWSQIEATEGTYTWDQIDDLMQWARTNDLPVIAGPLVDFSPRGVPTWLEKWNGDLQSLANFLYDYVETALRRYNAQIRIWQITAGSNCSSILSLGEDRLLWLTLQLLEMARQVDNELHLIVGIAQPWGEYLAWEERTYSPFVFADTLLRSKAQITCLDLELVMGVTARGSYLRDTLEISRLMDLYALLGLPLRVTLGCPSASTADPHAPDYEIQARGAGPEWSPELQAAWGRQIGTLAACKPFVEGVSWTHWTDAEPHVFPHTGLLDTGNVAKPVLAEIQKVREQHLV
jgi:hypothetical protein